MVTVEIEDEVLLFPVQPVDHLMGRFPVAFFRAGLKLPSYASVQVCTVVAQHVVYIVCIRRSQVLAPFFVQSSFVRSLNTSGSHMLKSIIRG